MEERDERQLALISKKVLNRPQECLLALKQQLELRMIRDENDHRPRVWQAQGSTFKLFFPAMQGVTQLDLTPLSPRSECLTAWIMLMWGTQCNEDSFLLETAVRIEG